MIVWQSRVCDHVVDLTQYGQTQGYSGIIYSEKTMHAIGWVLRHTFPFMGIDRYEDECLEWSRAAGQFAIREVIKQLEGSQYVRDYWRMDDFYRATGQAPKEYLEYARWLAANALTYAQMTGEITVSNVSVSVANGVWLGHSEFSTTANIYAHLDYQSKISSAEAMLTGLGMS